MVSINEEIEILKKGKKKKYVQHVRFDWVKGSGMTNSKVALKFWHNDGKIAVVAGVTVQPDMITTFDGLSASEIMNPNSSYNEKYPFYKRFIIIAVDGIKVHPELKLKHDSKGQPFYTTENVVDENDEPILHPMLDMNNVKGGYFREMNENKVHKRELSDVPRKVTAQGVQKENKVDKAYKQTEEYKSLSNPIKGQVNKLVEGGLSFEDAVLEINKPDESNDSNSDETSDNQ